MSCPTPATATLGVRSPAVKASWFGSERPDILSRLCNCTTSEDHDEDVRYAAAQNIDQLIAPELLIVGWLCSSPGFAKYPMASVTNIAVAPAVHTVFS
jgi:hypothetical protein